MTPDSMSYTLPHYSLQPPALRRHVCINAGVVGGLKSHKQTIQDSSLYEAVFPSPPPPPPAAAICPGAPRWRYLRTTSYFSQ